jgi:hypothetical protein
VPGGGDLRARRNTREVEEFYSGERGVLPETATRDSRLATRGSWSAIRDQRYSQPVVGEIKSGAIGGVGLVP